MGGLPSPKKRDGLDHGTDERCPFGVPLCLFSGQTFGSLYLQTTTRWAPSPVISRVIPLYRYTCISRGEKIPVKPFDFRPFIGVIITSINNILITNGPTLQKLRNIRVPRGIVVSWQLNGPMVWTLASCLDIFDTGPCAWQQRRAWCNC